MRTAGLFNNLGANNANTEHGNPLSPEFHIRAWLTNVNKSGLTLVGNSIS